MAFSYQAGWWRGAARQRNYDFIINLYDNPTVGAPVAGCHERRHGQLSLTPAACRTASSPSTWCAAPRTATCSPEVSRWIDGAGSPHRYADLRTLRGASAISPAPTRSASIRGRWVDSTSVASNFGQSVLNVASSSHRRHPVGLLPPRLHPAMRAVGGDSPSGAAALRLQHERVLRSTADHNRNVGPFSTAPNGNGLDVQDRGAPATTIMRASSLPTGATVVLARERKQTSRSCGEAGSMRPVQTGGIGRRGGHRRPRRRLCGSGNDQRSLRHEQQQHGLRRLTSPIPVGWGGPLRLRQRLARSKAHTASGQH